MSMSEWHRHVTANRLQSLLLVAILLGISALAGGLLFGAAGLWIALVASLVAVLIEPVTVYRLTLALYGARPIAPQAAPELWRMIRILAERAGLPAIPVPYPAPGRPGCCPAGATRSRPGCAPIRPPTSASAA